jgi:hypothetical protein
MRQQMKTAVVIIALALGLMWVAPSIHSQTTATDGPSLQETLDYIRSKLISDQNVRYENIAVSSDHETITTSYDFFFHSDVNPRWISMSYSAPVADLNASDHLARAETYFYTVYIGCRPGNSCATQHSERLDGPGTPIGSIRLSGFPLDKDQADRLVKAFTHLVQLLQAEYQVRHHNDPKDPFQ